MALTASMSSLMTVDEARKLLGDTAQGMTDSEIGQLIFDMQLLATHALDLARQKNSLLGDIESTSV